MITVYISHRSTVKRHTVSARTYAGHPKTEVLVASICTPQNEMIVIPGLCARRFISSNEHYVSAVSALIGAGEPVLCHDLPLTRELWRKENLPEPASWIEFENLARLGGYPSDIEACSRIIGQAIPADAGCQASSGGFVPVNKNVFVLIQAQARVWISVINAIAARVGPLYTPQEHKLFQVHHTINQNGIELDKSLASKILEIASRASFERNRQVQESSDGRITGDDLQRIERLKEILAGEGVKIPDLRSDTIEKELENENLSELARCLLEARLGQAKVAYKRLSRALAFADSDNKLRDMLRSNGAHTGRYASTGVQLHNLPKPIKGINYQVLLEAANRVDLDGLRAAVPTGDLNDAITALIRLVFIPSLGKAYVIIDWSAIEPRGWCWLAGCAEHLEMFKKNECIYSRMSSKLFGRPVQGSDRDYGKVTILGGGYQMGAARFDEYVTQFGIDLAAVNLTSNGVIDSFRKEFWKVAHPKTGLWTQLHHAAIMALYVRRSVAGCRFEKSRDAGLDPGLRVWLPSGRPLFYPGATVEMRPPGYDKTAKPVKTFVYYPPHSSSGSGRVMYGGKWLENITQAIGRDLLADVMLKTAEAGLPPTIHCHDEIVWEVDRNDADEFLKVLSAIMETPPEWAPSLPLAVKGFVADRYYKEAPKQKK